MKPLLALAAILVAAAAPASTSAAVNKADPAGDVKLTTLPLPQRNALDLVRVKAIGHKKVGSLVVVKLASNFDRKAGRKRLRRASATAKFLGGQKFALKTSGRRGRARVSASSSAIGAYAAVRRGHTIRFWVATANFGGFSRMRIETRNGALADTLRSKVAGSIEGCVTADDIYRRARAERGHKLATPADTARMRTAMAKVIAELKARRKARCASGSPPGNPAPSPECNAFAEPTQDKEILVAETCNRSAVDFAVIEIPDGRVTPDSAQATGVRGGSPCTIPDERTVHCSPDQKSGESTTIFFDKTPTVKVGDKLTLTLFRKGEQIYKTTLLVRNPT